MTLNKALQMLTALLLLGLLFAGLDGGQALSLLAQADLGWLATGLLALTAQTLLSAWRWQFTATRLGQTLTIGRAIREYYLGQVVNQSLPGGVLGDAGRAYRARHDGGLRRAGTAVMIERTLGQLALLAIMLTAFLLYDGPPLPATIKGLITAICLGGALLMTALLVVTWWRGWLAVARPALLDRGALPRQIGLNLAIAGLNIAGFACCAHATGTLMTAPQAALYVPLILLTMVIPITISGWGIREGAAATLFPLIGASASAGLAASTAFGLMFLLSTLPGLLVLALQGSTSPRYPKANLTVDP
ncbi:lysylphosphatidylglycerol synthase transmembrane domain-containing protein [Paracoccus sp. R86501]|uniref:lysylphosphatidylglycerol synthase transmembrane domain-containing protein n=1 Tax=Paracoccus sp. R86501 TaxID=3101711 RepID=UPI0036733499